MKIIKTKFDGLFIIENPVFNDNRGSFIKTYNQYIYRELGIDLEIRERYYSISNKNVIRGMHFQTPPYDHIKLVNVINGRICDVALDLRKNSSTYGKYFDIDIDSKEGITLYIPTGFAHGFVALEDKTIIEYNQSTEYSPHNDKGIKFDSFGFNWKIENPTISERDQSFVSFDNFKSPF